jgi:hypothetical protein
MYMTSIFLFLFFLLNFFITSNFNFFGKKVFSSPKWGLNLIPIVFMGNPWSPKVLLSRKKGGDRRGPGGAAPVARGQIYPQNEHEWDQKKNFWDQK